MGVKKYIFLVVIFVSDFQRFEEFLKKKGGNRMAESSESSHMK